MAAATMSAAPAVLRAYRGAAVSKHFPGWGWFAGTVTQVDVKGTDDKPFYISYDDGDSEWLSLQELQQVLVDGQPVARTPGKRAAAKPARRRDQKQQCGAAAADDASDDASDGDDEADGHVAQDQPAAAAGRKRPAAAASRSGGGAKRHKGRDGKASAHRQQAAGEQAEPAPAAAAAATAVEDGAVPAGAAAASPISQVDDVAGLIDDIAQAAGDTARRLNEGRSLMRLVPSSAPPAGTGLPAMSQGVVAGGACMFSLYGQPRTQAAASAPDYTAEASEVLAELDSLLAAAGSGRNLVVKAVVHLRSMDDGVRAFTDAWNAWAHPESLPVLTLLEGAGPVPGAGIVLEVTTLCSQEAN